MYWHEAKTTLLKPLFDGARIGLITDFDGTLSPIVPDPDAARATEDNTTHLRELVPQLTLLAFVSGRAAADLQQRVALPGAVYVGNHGLERWTDGEVSTHQDIAPYLDILSQLASQIETLDLDGMRVENKRATLSVHYRNTADPTAAASQLKTFLQPLIDANGLKLFSGRMVYEVRPPVEVNKGTAFRDLVRDYQLDAAIFIGDDTTDADAMKAARSLRDAGQCYSLAFGVESDDTPGIVRDSADLLLEGVPGVEDFLSWFKKSVSASSS